MALLQILIFVVTTVYGQCSLDSYAGTQIVQNCDGSTNSMCILQCASNYHGSQATWTSDPCGGSGLYVFPSQPDCAVTTCSVPQYENALVLDCTGDFNSTCIITCLEGYEPITLWASLPCTYNVNGEYSFTYGVPTCKAVYIEYSTEYSPQYSQSFGGYGSGVALSDGSVLAVGEPGADNGTGAIYVFNATNPTDQPVKLQATDFIAGALDGVGQGSVVKLSIDGWTLVASGPFDDNYNGAVWVWWYDGATWTLIQKLVANDANGQPYQGLCLDMNENGTTIVVGGPYEGPIINASNSTQYTGAAWIYKYNATTQNYIQLQSKLASPNNGEDFAYGLAISGDAEIIVIGAFTAQNHGGVYVYIFSISANAYVQQGGLLFNSMNPLKFQGSWVTANFDGSLVAIGSGDGALVGSLDIYDRINSRWVPIDVNSTSSGIASMAFSRDGTVLVCGEINITEVYICDGYQCFIADYLAVDFELDTVYGFGENVATNTDGSVIVIGSPDSYGKSGGLWTFLSYNVPESYSVHVNFSDVTPENTSYGNPVTFTVNVSGGSNCNNSDGYVTIFSDNTIIGVAPVTLVGTQYQATFVTSNLPAGNLTIFAYYTSWRCNSSYDSAYYTVIAAPTNTSLVDKLVGSTIYGNPLLVTFTAPVTSSVSAAIADGVLAFADANIGQFDIEPLDSTGVATLTLPLSMFDTSVQAQYLSDEPNDWTLSKSKPLLFAGYAESFPALQSSVPATPTGFIGGYGSAVALSGGGDMLLVGEMWAKNGNGSVYYYVPNGANNWSLVQTLSATNAVVSADPNNPTYVGLGYAISMSLDGTVAAIGGPYDNNMVGGTWVYNFTKGIWVFVQKLVANDFSIPNASLRSIYGSEQGSSLQLSSDGKTLLVGASCDGPIKNVSGALILSGAAWFYKVGPNGKWAQVGTKITSPEGPYKSFALNVALSGDANIAAIGCWLCNNQYGMVYIYTYIASTGVYALQLPGVSPLYDTTGYQGAYVALSFDGSVLAMGGGDPNSGSINAFYGNPVNGYTQFGDTIFTEPGINSMLFTSDGNTLITGLYNSTALYTYVQLDSFSWYPAGNFPDLTDYYSVANNGGFTIASTWNGDVIVMGGANDNTGYGTAWTYTRPVRPVQLVTITVNFTLNFACGTATSTLSSFTTNLRTDITTSCGLSSSQIGLTFLGCDANNLSRIKLVITPGATLSSMDPMVALRVLNAQIPAPSSLLRKTTLLSTILPQDLVATATFAVSYRCANKAIVTDVSTCQASSFTEVISLSDPHPTYLQTGVTCVVTVSQGTPNGVNPTGTVQLKDNNVNFGNPVTLDSFGKGSFPISTTVGNHSLTSVYSGDSKYSTSTVPLALAFVYTIGPAVTVTSLASSNPAPYRGDSLTCTATIALAKPGTAPITGTVSFYDGTTAMGTANVTTTGGVSKATYSSSALLNGVHTIKAVYNPTNAALVATSSQTMSQTVVPSTVTNLTAAPIQQYKGKPITFTATVTVVHTALVPAGTVSFFAVGTAAALGTANLTKNTAGLYTAVFAYSGFTVGPHSVTASFNPTNAILLSVSSPISVNVLTPTSLTAITISPATVYNGDYANVTATITVSNGVASAPAGTVVFQDGAIKSTAIAVTTSGTARIALYKELNLAVGTHVILATFTSSNTANLLSSTAKLNLTVLPQTTQCALTFNSTSPVNHLIYLNFTGAVTITHGAGPLDGTLTISHNGVAIPSPALVSIAGVYKSWLVFPNLTIGAHTMSISYVSTSGKFQSCTASVAVTIAARKCPAPPVTANMHQNCANANSNTTCTLTCTLGYKPSVIPLQTYCFDGSWTPVNGNCSQACPAGSSTSIALTATNTAFAANFKNWIGFGWQWSSTFIGYYELAWSNVQVFLNYTCGTSTAIKTSTAFKPSFTSPFYYNQLGGGSSTQMFPLPYNGANNGDIWQVSVQYDQIPLCGSNTTANKVKITSVQLTANLASNVSMSVTSQFHYFIPISNPTKTITNQNLTTYCSTKTNFGATQYAPTCNQLLWGSPVTVAINGCPNF